MHSPASQGSPPLSPEQLLPLHTLFTLRVDQLFSLLHHHTSEPLHPSPLPNSYSSLKAPAPMLAQVDSYSSSQSERPPLPIFLAQPFRGPLTTGLSSPNTQLFSRVVPKGEG